MVLDDVLEELNIVKDTFRNKIITTNYKKISPNEIGWDNYRSGISKSIYAKAMVRSKSN